MIFKVDGMTLQVSNYKEEIKYLQEQNKLLRDSFEKYTYLNDLFSEMLKLPDLSSIYKLILSSLQKNISRTVILFNVINETSLESKLIDVVGINASLLKKVLDIAGFNPIGKIYRLIPEHNDYCRTGKLVEFKGGLAQFSASELSPIIAHSIEKLIGLQRIHTIGITKDEHLLATIHFLSFSKSAPIDSHFIETLVKQAGIIIQKKISDIELIAAKEKAEESDRLKSAFLANMSHEIRTPMNGILGFASLLKNKELSGEEQEEYFNIIEKSGERMLNIINDLINISKVESGLMELSYSQTNLKEQFDFLLNFFSPEANHKMLELTVNYQLSDSQSRFITDPEKIYAILTNLIKNAIKFTDKGSIEIGCESIGTNYKFYVKDTGIGISLNKQKSIFERFVQADLHLSRGYEGAGLGLSISKAYVEMLGGTIWLESEPGVGSCFYFTIPVVTKAK